MAVKTRAQRLTVLKEIRDLWTAEVTDYATFLTNLEALLAALEAGDAEAGDQDLLDAAAAIRAARDAYGVAIIACYFATHKMLGNYGGTLNVLDVQQNLAKFHDKLVTDGDAFLERIAPANKPASFSAGGSNVGNGVVMVAKTATAQGGDVGHVQTWTLRCTKSSPETVTGAEEYKLTGAVTGLYPTQEGGTGEGVGYQYRASYGVSPNLPAPAQADGDGIPGDGMSITNVGTSSESGNLVADGGFEGGSGTTLGGDWEAAGSNATRNTTTPIEGSADLKFAGNDTVTQEGVGAKLSTLCYYGLICWMKKTGTPTGSFTLKLKDGSTDHITLTQDVSALSGTSTPVAFGTVFLPANADIANLKLEAAIANFGGSGSFEVDKVILRKLVVVEGIAIGPTGGLVATAKKDTYTAAVAQSNANNLQYMNNRAFGRGLPSASSAVNWGD